MLSINNLSISFFSENKETEVVKSVSYNLFENEILGIVGESGSGKSVSTLAVLGLLPKTISKITSGSILDFSRTYEFFKSIYDLRQANH